MGTTCLFARGGLAHTLEFFCHRAFFECSPVAAKQGNKCGVSSTRISSGLGRDAKVTSNRCPSTPPWGLFPGPRPHTSPLTVPRPS